MLATGCYLFQRLPSTYREARQHCRDQGGHLAEIMDQQEFDALEAAWRLTVPGDESKDRRSYWLGLNDIKQEGSWVAESSGKRQTFTVWHGGLQCSSSGRYNNCVAQMNQTITEARFLARTAPSLTSGRKTFNGMTPPAISEGSHCS